MKIANLVITIISSLVMLAADFFIFSFSFLGSMVGVFVYGFSNADHDVIHSMFGMLGLSLFIAVVAIASLALGIAAYVQALFAGNTDGHDAEHTLRVYRNALAIAAREKKCDMEIVSLAALLHDVDDHKLFQTENNANANVVKVYWYVINNSSTNALTYTIDQVYLGL